MKTYLLFFTIFLFGTNLFAQDDELSYKLISQFENLSKKSLNKSATVQDHLGLTPILSEVHRKWNVLNEEAKNVFKAYLGRPEFTGTEEIFTYKNFAFHYSIDGPSGESVDSSDINSNDIPDYIESMAHIFGDNVYDLYHTLTGLTIPPSDDDEFNGAYYDIYICEIDDSYYGYCAPERRIGDNPNSLILTEIDASTSYMVVRNNYTGFGDENIALSVTAAHEYMHAIQFGYCESMDTWFMESCAAWSEEFSFPGYDDNFQYLRDFFRYPDVSLNFDNGVDPQFDGHYYSSWIFVEYLTEQTSISIIKNIYERCIHYWAVDAIEIELTENWNSSFSKQFKNFVIANVVMDNSSAYAPYTYQRSPDYLTYFNDYGGLRYEHSFNYAGINISFNGKSDGNGRLMNISSDYFMLESNSDFRMFFTPANVNAESEFILLKVNKTTHSISVQTSTLQANQAVIDVTDYSSWEYFVPVIIRYDMHVKYNNSSDIVSDQLISNYSILIANTSYTAVDENSDNSGLIVFPNPASDFINISYSGEINGNVNYELFNMAGIKVQSLNSEKNFCTIDISNLANGVYTLKASGNDTSLFIKKVIVTH